MLDFNAVQSTLKDFQKLYDAAQADPDAVVRSARTAVVYRGLASVLASALQTCECEANAACDMAVHLMTKPAVPPAKK